MGHENKAYAGQIPRSPALVTRCGTRAQADDNSEYIISFHMWGQKAQ